jgi:hypothetical protein
MPWPHTNDDGKKPPKKSQSVTELDKLIKETYASQLWQAQLLQAKYKNAMDNDPGHYYGTPKDWNKPDPVLIPPSKGNWEDDLYPTVSMQDALRFTLNVVGGIKLKEPYINYMIPVNSYYGMTESELRAALQLVFSRFTEHIINELKSKGKKK